jgi:hypothetical protein
VFTISFFAFAATTLWLVGSAIFIWLTAPPSSTVAVVHEDEELDDDDEPGEPLLPAEPQPSSGGGLPSDEFLIDWDEFDAARAAYEDIVAALKLSRGWFVAPTHAILRG